MAFGMYLEEKPSLALKDSGDILQTEFWSRVKEKGGWKSYSFSLQNLENDKVVSLLVLVRKIAGIISFGYVPHGPDLDALEVTKDQIPLFLENLSRELLGYLPLGCLFVRYDLLTGTTFTIGSEDPENFPSKLGRPLVKASMDIQPPDTVVVDISGTEEDVLARMHKKTRYNIRLAAKKGVIVTEGTDEDLEKWYKLYQETSIRDKIAIHGLDYYKRVFSLSKESEDYPHLKLLLASHEGDLLAGNIVVFYKDTAIYLYGASVGLKRNLMPAYAIQWETIRQARENGCIAYDLFGIPPVNNPDHPMSGLYRFKTGFGGTIHHRDGCWDYPFSKIVYPLYRLMERLRKYYYKTFKKR